MNKIVISIGRQFGSGGREIGRKLAGRLQIPYYDKELITLAAKESGIADEFFTKMDENHSSLLSCLGLDGLWTQVFGDYDNALSSESLFNYQSDVIREISSESCVIVGRCSNYVLREESSLFSIFLHAPIEHRMKYLRKNKDFCEYSDDKLKALIEKTDKMRSSYYNFYSNNEWGSATSYNLCIDTSVLDIDSAVDLVYDAIKRKI